MKKTVLVLVSLLALVFAACSQIPFPGPTSTPGTGPTVDSAATADAQFKTAVAQTLTAQPTLAAPSESATATAVEASPTPAVSNTDTPTPVSGTSSPVNTETTAFTPTQLVDLTATGIIPTATNLPANGTSTPTLVAGQVTAIWTLAIRTYGTLPPAVPSSQVTLINKANAEAYISLQVTMPDGKYSIIEYPVEGRVKIQAPVGSYLYVAWVGGRKMVGEFRLTNNHDISITLYKDRVVIK